MLKNFWITFCILFVALDILGALPLFLTLTSPLSEEKKTHIVQNSMLVAFVVACIFLLLGENIFVFLGITIADFKIAGGLVLLLCSLVDLVGSSRPHHPEASTGIVPLAVPMITGPAIITSSFLQMQSVGLLITLIALTANYLIAWAVLQNANYIAKWMGKDGTVIFSKLAALLLSAIAVAMIRSGVIACFVKS
jgi:multiple antibiotic resistance protein